MKISTFEKMNPETSATMNVKIFSIDKHEIIATINLPERTIQRMKDRVQFDILLTTAFSTIANPPPYYDATHYAKITLLVHRYIDDDKESISLMPANNIAEWIIFYVFFAEPRHTEEKKLKQQTLADAFIKALLSL